MKPGTKTFVVELPTDPNDPRWDTINKAMAEHQDNVQLYIEKLAKELGVSIHCAGCVHYLRGRSRWTQEKEDQLIQLDKEGKELPNVLAGEL